ncbi:MAG: hypothetical protein WCS74_01340 [Dehalococcoidales bacterium]
MRAVTGNGSMSDLPVGSHQEIVNRMKTAISAGKHWYLALIEAMRDYPEENYLIGGDALDWISLARMLVRETGDNIISPRETGQFFNHGKPPLKIAPAEARQLMGDVKYNLYLNYLYGVTVESALLRAVVAEIEKEFTSLGLAPPEDAKTRAFLAIYEDDEDSLHKIFIGKNDTVHERQKQYNPEFVYWLFKYRLKNSDKEKVASDTKKALNWLKTGSHAFPRLFC